MGRVKPRKLSKSEDRKEPSIGRALIIKGLWFDALQGCRNQWNFTIQTRISYICPLQRHPHGGKPELLGRKASSW